VYKRQPQNPMIENLKILRDIYGDIIDWFKLSEQKTGVTKDAEWLSST